jgi:integrative and conjugative element protein (TIGR02256 family)
MIVLELGDIILRIDQKVFNVLMSFIQDKKDKPESGGILIGYYIDEFSFYISDLSIPSEKDKKSRFNFVRSFISAQEVIDNFFKKSKGKKIYLGEWHTHPEKVPIPSSTDLNSFQNQLKTNKLNSKFIFMVIIGTEGIFVAFYSNSDLMNKVQLPFVKLLNDLLY